MSNLKERLADMSALNQSRTPADALKYIEKLEADNWWLRLEVQHANGAVDVAIEWAKEFEAKRTSETEELEAKLAKATEALENSDRVIMEAMNNLDFKTIASVFNRMSDIRTAIAELKGESNER